MPTVQEDSGVITVDELIQQVSDLTGTSLDGARVDLFTNDITPDRFTVLDDLDLAAYTGYVQGVVTAWTTIETLADGTVTINSTNVMTFVGPAAGGGPTAYGYVMRVAAPGTRVIRIARFPAGESLEDDSKVINLVANYNV